MLRIGGVGRSGTLGSAALLLLLTVLVALASHPAVSQNPCSPEVLSEVVRTLEELSSRFVDVGGAVEYLDQLLKACSRGDVGGASSIYSKLAETLGHLREYSRTRFWEVMAYRATYTAALALVPILTYVLLPRAYLYLWYLARRSWTVVRRR